MSARRALRNAIQTHNCAIGIANGDGYHETLTVYYLTAVAEADAPGPEALDDIESCDRTAPLRHWSRDELFSVAARRGSRAGLDTVV